MFNQTISFAPQGWECPKCKRIYSPATMMCIHCVPNPISPTTSGTSWEYTDTNPQPKPQDNE